MSVASRRNGYKISHETLEEMRYTAIRMVDHGMRVEDVASGMRLNRSTVFGWIHKYRKGGSQALKSTKATGAHPKLTQIQVLKMIKYLRLPATEYGFDSDLWTGPRVRILIRNKFGVTLHSKHMPRFLRRLGMIRKSPERRALEQDQKAVSRWRRHELPTITRCANRCKGLILYGDEALFALIPHIGKTWTFPDLKPIARVSGKRGIHVGVTSAVSSKGHLVFQLSKSNFNARTLIHFIKTLHKHFIWRKLFLIIDGAPSHKAKVVKQFVSDNTKWLSLHYIPSYSPELNPDEKVWRYTKTMRLNATPMKDKEELKSSVLKAMKSLQKRPNTIKGFFDK